MGSLVASQCRIYGVKLETETTATRKSHQNESAVSTIYYRYTDEEVDHLSETKDDGTELKQRFNGRI